MEEVLSFLCSYWKLKTKKGLISVNLSLMQKDRKQICGCALPLSVCASCWLASWWYFKRRMSIALVCGHGQDAGGQRSSVSVQNVGQLGGNTSAVFNLDRAPFPTGST